MFKIGLFSLISKTTIKTLRYYDEIGLLKPSYIDENNSYRYYSYEQLSIIHLITSLKQSGFNNEEISKILNGHNNLDIVFKRKEELESEIDKLNEKLLHLNNLIKEKEGGIDMDYKAVIKELPKCIVYSRKMRIPTYSSYFKVIPETGEKVGKKYPDLKCMVPEYCFIIYHDGEYKEKDINVEYCEAVTEMRDSFDDIVFKEINSVKSATVLHKGKYEDLGNAYAYLLKWINENGYRIIDKPRENYLNGIWNTENEDEWLTEIQIPIE